MEYTPAPITAASATIRKKGEYARAAKSAGRATPKKRKRVQSAFVLRVGIALKRIQVWDRR